MNKKLLSLIMAVAMIATLAVPALATGTRTGDTLDFEVDMATPTVEVRMPRSPRIILNPYGMTVTVDTDTGAKATSSSTNTSVVSGQILGVTQYITNETASPMKVGVKATAVVSGDTILSAKFCTGKETTKSAFLVVELQNSTTSGTAMLNTGWFTNVASGDSSINEKCYPQIVPTTAGKSAPAILSVPAALDASGAASPNYIAVQTFGNLSTAPTDGWTSTDTATVNLEFTFTPTVTHKATVSGTGVTAESSISSAGSTAEAVMGGVIRLNATNKKAPTVKDAGNAVVTVTKVTDTLYYFIMPATDVTVTPGT